jgi:hypothetical protein
MTVRSDRGSEPFCSHSRVFRFSRMRQEAVWLGRSYAAGCVELWNELMGSLYFVALVSGCSLNYLEYVGT